MSKITIFDPRGVKPEDYRFVYPELGRIPEFKSLSANALIFVWYYANPTSPIILLPDNERVIKAFELSSYKPDEELQKRIKNLTFPELLAVAIDRMQRFRADQRARAKQMIEDIMTHYENIATTTLEDYKDEKGNLDRIKYVNTTAKIVEELPQLLNLLEEGFGVGEKGDDSEGSAHESLLREVYKSKET